MRPRFIVPFFTLGAILLAHPLSHAETKVLTAEANYTMGDGESPAFAEAQVLQRAKQVALEQAGTYVETYTKIHNYDLTTEEIQTIAGGVLEVQVLEKKRVLVGDGLQFYVKIKATVTTDKMEELSRRIKGKNVAEEYKKLQQEYARLTQELDTWKQLAAKTPAGPEREAALDQIRDREKSFARFQKNEAVLFQHLMSGQALIAEGEDARALVDRLIESIKRDGHVLEIGKVRAFPSKGAQDQVALTVPIRLKPSAILPSLLSDTATSLGGDGLVSIPHLQRFPSEPPAPKDFALLVYDFESIEKTRITVKTAPNAERHTIPRDNLYRRSIPGLTIGTPGNLVHLSRSQPLEDYFGSQVRKLGLVVDLNGDGRGFKSISCRVPFIVNRLISARDRNSELQYRFVAAIEEKASENRFLGDAPKSVLLLFSDVKFNVEFNLPSGTAVKVERVTARWAERQDAPKEVCHIVVENN